MSGQIHFNDTRARENEMRFNESEMKVKIREITMRERAWIAFNVDNSIVSELCSDSWRGK